MSKNRHNKENEQQSEVKEFQQKLVSEENEDLLQRQPTPQPKDYDEIEY
ncbi:hypothetical protein LCL95_07680 [Bacillus timonensis]|nr:hypothetical protein [Bacillus timonensis]